MAIFLIKSVTWDKSHPAVFRLMKQGQANVDGNMNENSRHTFGNADTGQEKPVRNIAIGDINRRATRTVSLFLKNELQVSEKNTQSATYKASIINISPNVPL